MSSNSWVTMVSVGVAIGALILNVIVIFVVTPRRDHGRWRRDRLEQHVLDVIEVSRSVRAEMTNLQVAVMAGTNQTTEDLVRSQTYVDAARGEQERQLAKLREAALRLSRPEDGISLYGSKALIGSMVALTTSMSLLMTKLDDSVRSVNQELVAFGPDYRHLLEDWVRAEEGFFKLARREIGMHDG